MKSIKKNGGAILLLVALLVLAGFLGTKPVKAEVVTKSGITTEQSGVTEVIKVRNQNKYDLYYQLDEAKRTAKIVGCTTYNPNTFVTIPETIRSAYTVTVIAKKAFYKQTNVSRLQDANNITTIEDYAFYGCSKLDYSDDMTKTLKVIGDYAFYGAGQVREFGFVYFKEINSIGAGAFMYSKVRRVEMLGSKNTLEEIPKYCFYMCQELTCVDLSKDAALRSVGESAFSCSGITMFLWPNNNKVSTIESKAFESCEKLVETVIPFSVSFIRDYAFRYCPKLKSISSYCKNNDASNSCYTLFGAKTTFAQNISIGKEAFYFTGLESICFASRAIIGARAFMMCPMKKALVLCKESEIQSRAFGYKSDNAQDTIKGFMMYGEVNAKSYAATVPGMKCNLWVESSKVTDYSKYRFDAMNRTDAFGKDGKNYLDPRHTPLNYSCDTFNGVCTGISFVSALSYYKDHGIGTFNLFSLVPDMKKSDGTVVKKLSEINKDNINDETRSVVTDYWRRQNEIPTYSTYNMNLLFRYCMLINLGINKPVPVRFNKHSMVAYGAEYKPAGSTDSYWTYYDENGNYVTSFNARIYFYDCNYQYLSDGTIDNGWASATPKTSAYTCLYLNTNSGRWNWMNGSNCYLGDYRDIPFGTNAEGQKIGCDMQLYDVGSLIRMAKPVSLR